MVYAEFKCSVEDRWRVTLPTTSQEWLGICVTTLLLGLCFTDSALRLVCSTRLLGLQTGGKDICSSDAKGSMLSDS